MEELRSAEILDKEIQAEARHKVETLLKNTEAECNKLASGVEQRVEDARREKEEFYNKKFALAKNDMDASFPLEKSRFEVSFLHDEIVKAFNSYLKNLSAEKHLEILLSQLDLQKDLISGKKFYAYVYGLELKAAKSAISKKIGSALIECKSTEFGKYVLEEDCGLDFNEGIILEAEDNTLRLRMTMVQVFSVLFDKYRAELASALFEEM